MSELPKKNSGNGHITVDLDRIDQLERDQEDLKVSVAVLAEKLQGIVEKLSESVDSFKESVKNFSEDNKEAGEKFQEMMLAQQEQSNKVVQVEKFIEKYEKKHEFWKNAVWGLALTAGGVLATKIGEIIWVALTFHQ